MIPAAYTFHFGGIGKEFPTNRHCKGLLCAPPFAQPKLPRAHPCKLEDSHQNVWCELLWVRVLERSLQNRFHQDIYRIPLLAQKICFLQFNHKKWLKYIGKQLPQYAPSLMLSCLAWNSWTGFDTRTEVSTSPSIESLENEMTCKAISYLCCSLTGV